MSDHNNDVLSRRNAIKLGVASLSSAGLVAGVQAHKPDEVVKTPFVVAQTFIPIAGGNAEFPVRRIYCIGRNYAAHAREMGSDPTREPPFFFQKPTDAIQFVAPIKIVDHPYPSLTKYYH